MEDLFYSYYRFLFFKEEIHYRNFLKLHTMIEDAKTDVNYPLRNELLSFYYYIQYNNKMIPSFLHFCVTDYCQLRCKHCYFGDYERKYVMTPDNVRTIVDKFTGIREFFLNNSEFSDRTSKTCNIAGGEPLLHPNLISIIDAIPSDVINVFKILSNGYRYDKKIIDISLNKYESFVYQISLDGLRDNHDFIRGNGSYDRAIATIKSIKRDFPNVFLQIAFNAHHHNNDDLLELTKIVKDLGCNKIFYDRYVPYWKSELVMLTQEEYNKHTAYINQAYDLYNDDTFTVFRARSLQFDNKYRCQSGVRNQIAKADGTRISCTRYHVECGNWYTDDVDTLVEKSIRAEIKTLPVPISCISCDRLKTCRGGMRCLSWACTNKFDIKDIHCVRR